MNFKRRLRSKRLQNQTLKNPCRHITTAKSQTALENNAVNSEKRKTMPKTPIIVLTIITIITVDEQILTLAKRIVPIIAMKTKQKFELTKKSRTAYPPCEICGITKRSTENSYFGANGTNRLIFRLRRPTGRNRNQREDTPSNAKESVQASAHTFNWKRQVLFAELHLTDRRPQTYKSSAIFWSCPGAIPGEICEPTQVT